MNPEDVTTVDILDAAIARLQRSGWTQKTRGGRQGPNCISGAVCWGLVDLTNWAYAVTIDGESKSGTAFGAVAQTLFPGCPNSKVILWNDAPDRTAEDAILALKQTLVLEEIKKEETQ